MKDFYKKVVLGVITAIPIFLGGASLIEFNRTDSSTNVITNRENGSFVINGDVHITNNNR